MISKELQVVFIHIPKCAGQSIEKCFLNRLNISWENRNKLLLYKNEDPEVGPPRLAHLTAEEYTKYLYLNKQDFDQYFKFTFVRNPWTRLVSEYIWGNYYKQGTFKNWLFKNFPKKGWSDDWRHVMPQYEYIYSSNSICLVDYIGKFENIKFDFDKIKQMYDLPDLPHSNVSILNNYKKNSFFQNISKSILFPKKRLAKDYFEYYDMETWNFVADMYYVDIKTFGYSKYLSYIR